MWRLSDTQVAQKRLLSTGHGHPIPEICKQRDRQTCSWQYSAVLPASGMNDVCWLAGRCDACAGGHDGLAVVREVCSAEWDRQSAGIVTRAISTHLHVAVCDGTTACSQAVCHRHQLTRCVHPQLCWPQSSLWLRTRLNLSAPFSDS